MDWQIPLIVSALVFVAFLMWRMRPAMGDDSGPGARARALRDAKERIRTAKDDTARAEALCDAGVACAQMVGRGGSAAQYFLRAMRSDPANVEIVTRAAKALERRPMTLESMLWRRLGTEGWEGAQRDAALAALAELALAYRRSLRHRVRGAALASALAALGRPLPPVEAPDSSSASIQGQNRARP
jgi:hypothetical protein